MTAVQAPARPQPLPIPAGGSPETWGSRDLVKQTNHYKSEDFESTYRSGGVNGSDGPQFSPLQAASFTDALYAASNMSQDNPVAVLQAKDGAYFATHLVETGRNNGPMTHHDLKDLHETIELAWTDFRPLHPDVRAIVGKDTWVNFTDNKIARPGPAG